MKKKGVIDTLIKAGIAAAAIGGTVYLLKDKIEENPKYKEAVDKVKDTIKSYVPSKETPVEEEDFFDEDFDEIIHTSNSERGYVNIKLPGEEDFDDIAEKAEDTVEKAVDAVEEAVEAVEEFVEDITE